MTNDQKLQRYIGEEMSVSELLRAPANGIHRLRTNQ